MIPEPVEVHKPGHERHGQNGMVIAIPARDTYTVEFVDSLCAGRTSRHIENFNGRNLRAVLRIRVRV